MNPIHHVRVSTGGDPAQPPAGRPLEVITYRGDAPPVPSGWIVLDDAELDFLLNETAAAFEAWAATQPPSVDLPPPAPRWSTLDFIERFPLPKQLALLESSDPMVRLFIAKATAAGTVVADDPRTVQGMDYLVQTGLLTQAEHDAILAPTSP